VSEKGKGRDFHGGTLGTHPWVVEAVTLTTITVAGASVSLIADWPTSRSFFKS
jgi:hypothetical protein